MADILQEAVDAVARNKGNKAQAAEEIGVARSTLYGRLGRAERLGIIPKVLSVDTEVEMYAMEMEYKDRIRSLQKQLDSSTRENLTADKVRAYFFDLSEYPSSPPNWTLSPPKTSGNMPGVPTFQLSDWHFGEVVDPTMVNGVNEFNMEIAKERIQTLVRNVIDLYTNHMAYPQYPGVVVVLGGDMIAGDIHEDLTETNDGRAMKQVFELAPILDWALTQFADTFGQVFVVNTYGNHGRGTQKPRQKAAAYSNFDWLLGTMLESYTKNRNDDRFSFLVPNAPDALYRIYNTTYLATHGDRLGVAGGNGMIGLLGPIVRGVYKVKSYYASLGTPVDWVVMGHWHQRMKLDSVGGIVNGALKGYDEFAQSLRFDPTLPSQNSWITHPEYGITFNVPIWVTRKAELKIKSPWVSWADSLSV
jgi:transposase-like protein